jgi:hypothetical protein
LHIRAMLQSCVVTVTSKPPKFGKMGIVTVAVFELTSMPHR